MSKIFKMIHDNIIDHNNLQFICFDSGINNIKAPCMCVCVYPGVPQLFTELLHGVAHVLSAVLFTISL